MYVCETIYMYTYFIFLTYYFYTFSSTHCSHHLLPPFHHYSGGPLTPTNQPLRRGLLLPAPLRLDSAAAASGVLFVSSPAPNFPTPLDPHERFVFSHHATTSLETRNALPRIPRILILVSIFVRRLLQKNSSFHHDRRSI